MALRQIVVEMLLRMRAGDEQEDSYANQYLLTLEDQDREPDWDRFTELWEARENSDEDMAALLAFVMGVEYEEALAWVQGY